MRLGSVGGIFGVAGLLSTTGEGSPVASGSLISVSNNLTAGTWYLGGYDFNTDSDSYVLVYAKNTGTASYSLFVTKFTASTNTIQWSKQLYTSQAAWYPTTSTVTIHNDGSVAILYRGTTSSTYYPFICRFASDGTLTWQKKMTATLASAGWPMNSAGYYDPRDANRELAWVGTDLLLTMNYSGSTAPNNGSFHVRLNGSTGAATWHRLNYKSYFSSPNTYYVSIFRTLTASTPDGTKAIHAWGGPLDGSKYGQEINVYVASTGGPQSPSSLTYKGWSQTTNAQGLQISSIVADNSYVYCAGVNRGDTSSNYEVFLMAVSLSANTVFWRRRLTSSNVAGSGSFNPVPYVKFIPSGGFLLYTHLGGGQSWLVQKWSSDGNTIDWAYSIASSTGKVLGIHVDHNDRLLIYWVSKTTANAAGSVLQIDSLGGAWPYMEQTYTDAVSGGSIVLTKDTSAVSEATTSTYVALSTNSFTDTTATITLANPSAAESTLQTVTGNITVTTNSI